MKFNVEFVINRLTVRVQHRAAELAVTHHLGEVLFPAPNVTFPNIQLPSLRYSPLYEIHLAFSTHGCMSAVQAPDKRMQT